MGDWETDQEIDKETLRDFRGQGDFNRFFEGVFENERSTSSDRRKGGHYFGHGSASAVPLKPLFLKRLGDTGLPFSSERHKNRPHLTFSLGNNHIRGTRIDPIEASTLGDFSETLGDFWETETDKETDRKTIRETDRGDRLGNRLGDRPGD